jgi:signal transduction histidine kinase
MLSMRAKIVVLNTALFGIVLAAFATILYISVKHDGIVRLDSQLEQFAYNFGRTIGGDLNEADFPDTADIVELRAKGPKGIVYQLLDPAGRNIVGTAPPGVLPSISGFSYKTVGKKSFRCLSTELELLPEKNYLLLLSVPLDDVEAGLQHLFLVLALLIPFSLIVSVLIALLIIHYSFRPLMRVIQTAEEVTIGNLGKQIELPKTKDEIWILSNVFNEMMSRLAKAFGAQKQFVADSSHEIRTPLAIIRSELEYAQRHDLKIPVKESINISLSEIDRLAELAQGLLTLSQFDAGFISLNTSPIRLDTFVAETVRLVITLADNKAIHVSTTCSEPMIVSIDPDSMRRALLNILENAINFSPKSSVITVSINRSTHNHHIVEISITDQGSGIAPADIPYVFKRFYRADSARSEVSGSGLGLAIAEEIVHLHGGIISVQNKPGQGASFTIELPLQ